MLEVAEVSKRYGPVQALDRVSAQFLPGEIHGVLGENGAGKSTLMGVLAGFVTPDGGRAQWQGRPLPLGNPVATRAAGIEIVHQHFMLVPAFTVAENLALGRLGNLAGRLDVKRLAAPALALAERLGWAIDPDARTGGLPVGVQQRIEILKALSGDAPVLILDEPTAVLAPDEVDELFRILRQLRDDGKTVILIAHKLSEVTAIADRVTVLRRGVKVAESRLEGLPPRQLAEWMVGALPEGLARVQEATGEPSLVVRSLTVKGDRGETAVRGVTFDVRPGEILGFGGVDGNGQVELAEALAGVRPPDFGMIEWRPGGTPRTAYIPPDRKIQGLALGLSILDNLLIEGHRDPELVAGPFLRPRLVREWALGVVERFGIKIGDMRDPVRSLSGGNQQKVVVGRALSRSPELVVAANPTRGLDIRATDTVHACLLDAARAGAAVVLISTDLDELAALAHRTLFLGRGELVAADGASAVVGGPA